MCPITNYVNMGCADDYNSFAAAQVVLLYLDAFCPQVECTVPREHSNIPQTRNQDRPLRANDRRVVLVNQQIGSCSIDLIAGDRSSCTG